MKNLSNNIRLLKRLALTPIGLTLLLSIVVLIVSTLISYKIKTYTSDDVIWQSAIALHWRPFVGNTFYGDAGVTYILKLPLYVLVHLAISSPKHALLASGLILSIINFVTIFLCSLYFLRISKIKISRAILLPFIWLASFGFALSQLFLDTNMHNIEIAIIFLLITVTSKILRKELYFSKPLYNYITWLVIAIGMAISVIDDKYILYFGVAPSLLLIALNVKKWRLTKPIIGASISIVLGFVLIPVFESLLTLAGIRLISGNVAGTGPAMLVGFNDFGAYLANTLHSFLIVFGGDFFNKPAASLLTVLNLTNAALAFATLATAISVVRHYRQAKSNELLVLSFTFLFVIAIYAFSTLSGGRSETYRYLLLLPFLAPILLAVFFENTTYKKIFVGLFILAVILNVATSFLSLSDKTYKNIPRLQTQQKEFKQDYNFTLIHQLELNGLSKGYANYWNAGINTYLSEGNVKVLPISCYKHTTSPFTWLTTKGSFLDQSQQSFYVFNSIYPTCSKKEVVKQFGEPVKVLHLVENTTVYVYDYDLISRMNWTYL